MVDSSPTRMSSSPNQFTPDFLAERASDAAELVRRALARTTGLTQAALVEIELDPDHQSAAHRQSMQDLAMTLTEIGLLALEGAKGAAQFGNLGALATRLTELTDVDLGTLLGVGRRELTEGQIDPNLMGSQILPVSWFPRPEWHGEPIEARIVDDKVIMCGDRSMRIRSKNGLYAFNALMLSREFPSDTQQHMSFGFSELFDEDRSEKTIRITLASARKRVIDNFNELMGEDVIYTSGPSRRPGYHVLDRLLLVDEREIT